MRNNTRNRGFTLIELIVVIAILAILLSIAIPAYGSYVLKSKVRVAQTDLAALAANVENHLQRRLRYHPDEEASTAEVIAAFPGWAPTVGTDFEYSYEPGVPADGYTIRATWKETSDEKLEDCVVSFDSANAKVMTSQCATVMGSTTW